MDDSLTTLIRTAMPFAATLGLIVIEGSKDRLVVQAEWSADRCTAGGVLHGGFLMAAVDTTGATCAFLNLPEGAQGTATIESKTNFVGTVRSGTVTFTAEPVHVGRTTIVVQTDARGDDGRLVSRSLQTQAVLGGTETRA